MERRADFAKK
jgi:hypothetical protein